MLEGQILAEVQKVMSIEWRSTVAASDENMWSSFGITQGGLATAFDLAAFRLSMIAPVKKSVNHSKTVASMRERAGKNNKKLIFAAIRQCEENSLL